MSIQLLNNLSLAAYIVAGIFLLVAIMLFFTLNIPRVIGELSGHNAKKEIAEIRKQNKAASSNLTMHDVGAAHVQSAPGSAPTTPMQGGAQGATTPMQGGAQGATATAILDSPPPMANRSYGEQTAVLDSTAPGVPPLTNADSSITVEVEMGFTGSAELVE